MKWQRFEATMNTPKLQSECVAEADDIRVTASEIIEVHDLTLKEALHMAVLSLATASPSVDRKESPQSQLPLAPHES
jgi:hypothetical protein